MSATTAVAPLVYQSSTSVGLGDFTTVAVTGWRQFNEPFGTGATLNVFYYYIRNQITLEWEFGTGHMSASQTLVRDVVISSSNANAKVNFNAGPKDVSSNIPMPSPFFLNIMAQTAAGQVVAALGLGNMAAQNSNYIAVTGGTMDGVTIGADTTHRMPGAFTTLTATGATSLQVVTSLGHAVTGAFSATTTGLFGGALTVSSGGITVTAGGLTVSAGTSALQAVTATTVNATGQGTFSTVSVGTLQATSLATFAAGLNFTGATSPLQLQGSTGTTGQFLISGGPGVTPSWLTVATGSGTVNAGNQGGVGYYSAAANVISSTAAGTSGQVLISAGTGAPAFGNPDSLRGVLGAMSILNYIGYNN